MRQKYNCPDCGKEIIREGLCNDCRTAYSNSSQYEGLGEDVNSLTNEEKKEEANEDGNNSQS